MPIESGLLDALSLGYRSAVTGGKDQGIWRFSALSASVHAISRNEPHGECGEVAEIVENVGLAHRLQAV